MIKLWKTDKVKKKEGEGPTSAGDIVSFIEEEAGKRRRARLPFELQWRLNANFLLGNQHCDINVHRMTVENYQPLYDYMSNEVFNRISPIMETRTAHLMKQDCSLRALPASERWDETRRAEKVTEFLRTKLGELPCKRAFGRMLGLCEQTGSGFYLVWWDEAKKDVDLTVLTPYEVLPEDLCAEELENQKSIMIEQVKKSSELSSIYGVELKGESVDGYGMAQVGASGGFGYESASLAFVPTRQDGCLVLRTYMEKPSALRPDGRLCITAGGKLLYDGILPGGVYPLIHVKSKRVSGQFFGRSVIEPLIPLQRCYNGVKNRINDYINRCAAGQLLIEDGSVDADDLCEKGLVPGEPVIYRRGARLPELLDEPAMPDIAENQLKQLMQDMEYVAGVSGLMTDLSLPSGALSGKALENLTRLDTTRLGAYAVNIRLGKIALAEHFLRLYRTYAGAENETLRQGGVTVDDLASCKRVEEADERERESNPDGAKEGLEALSLIEKDGQTAYTSYLKHLLLREIIGKDGCPASTEERQVENAEKENEAFENGETLELMPFDDDELHLYAHREYLLRPAFRRMYKEDRERANAMLAHISEHLENLKNAGYKEEEDEQ